VEAVDEHGEVSTLWQLTKTPSQDLWIKGQVHIHNKGDKLYQVKHSYVSLVSHFGYNP
jgi:hypothetical protein